MWFVAAAGFALVGAVWTATILINGGTWWGPVHAFLLGTVLSAISGTSQMFTVTWAASRPAPRWLSGTQGVTLVVGVSLVLVGIGSGYEPAVVAGGILVVASLVLLATIIYTAVRSSLLRRFDLSARFYLLAMAAGVVGVSLGILLGTGTVAGNTYTTMRAAHLHINLVGLIGFTILGTIPTLIPTFAHQKTVSGKEAVIAWWGCFAAAVVMVAGVFSTVVLGVGVLLAAVSAGTILIGIVSRLEARKSRETLPLLQVSSGMVWLITWTLVDGLQLATGTPITHFSGWTMAAVVAGVGQVLLGSVAYLLPVVLGPPIGPNLARMGHLPLIPLLAANITGVALVANIAPLALAAGVIWALDLLRRLLTLRRPK